MGTGGVALFALEFASLLGARVIVTSSSDERIEKARALGATDAINYATTPDWDRAVKSLTDGRGVDHVLELGGAETLERSLRSVRFGGRVSLVGNLSGLEARLNLALVFMRSIRMQGILVGSREAFEAMNRAIELHQLKPVIEHVFPFEELPEAFARMKKQGHFGKLVLRVA